MCPLAANIINPSNQAIKRSQPHWQLQPSMYTRRPAWISMLPGKIRLCLPCLLAQTLHVYHLSRALISASGQHPSAAALSTRIATESTDTLSAMIIMIMHPLRRSRTISPLTSTTATSATMMMPTSQIQLTSCPQLRPGVLIQDRNLKPSPFDSTE